MTAIAAGEGLGSRGYQVEGLAYDGQVVRARLRQVERARFADEQFLPEEGFEAAYMLADRGLSQVKFRCGAGEGQVSRGRLECAKPCQRGQV